MSPEEADKLPSALQVKLTCSPNGKVQADALYHQDEKEQTVSKNFDRLPGVLVTPVGTLTLSPKDSTTIKESRTVLPLSSLQLLQPQIVKPDLVLNLPANLQP